ncbi:PfkB family carbohydrate kinase [Barrientosiimonas humi]|uniref:PfkB family carbohydrate kinase n=1 Tax=Barrientosiimonas humi TaxID=999931 RepID=UPI001C3E2131|nr:PfkB family carbohydrate kinase [Barrientosiimonas humi]
MRRDGRRPGRAGGARPARTGAARLPGARPGAREAEPCRGGSDAGVRRLGRAVRSRARRATGRDGAGAAIVSDGAAGLTLVSGDGIRLVGRLPEPLQGNATGAGDALTAALAAGLAEGVPTGRDAWAETLRTGVAWSAAAVLQPVAGAVDPADVARLLPRVEIEEIA